MSDDLVLTRAGYTYDYISPDNFKLPEAYVKDGILAPERQAYKAMIVRANDSMTVAGAGGIAKFAYAGLPIIFSGGIPTIFISYNASGAVYVNETLESLRNLTNVHIVSYDNLAKTLSGLNINPATKLSANRVWYTMHRRDDSASADYFFVYNDASTVAELNGGHSEGTIEFANTGAPYFYDAWTGAQTVLSNYTQTNSSTSIWLQLAGNQTAIIAFHDTAAGEANNHHHHTAWNSTHRPSPYTPLAATSASATQSLVLSNWTLVVERWDPPSNLSNIDTIAVKTNTTVFHLPTLVSWQKISGLQNVSGRGYYSTSFVWPPANSTSDNDRGRSASSQVWIDLGASFHSLRVTVNNHTLPPLDLTWARADITSHLYPVGSGRENVVQAVVATPLYNTLYSIWGQLKSSGLRYGADLGINYPINGVGPTPRLDYGLLGEVKILGV